VASRQKALATPLQGVGGGLLPAVVLTNTLMAVKGHEVIWKGISGSTYSLHDLKLPRVAVSMDRLRFIKEAHALSNISSFLGGSPELSWAFYILALNHYLFMDNSLLIFQPRKGEGYLVPRTVPAS
jgi:hypothetical protein